MLIVTLSAVVTMVAEAFRPKNERVPMGGLGIIGLVGALSAHAAGLHRLEPEGVHNALRYVGARPVGPEEGAAGPILPQL